MIDQVTWYPRYAGDRTLVLEFGSTIDKTLVARVAALDTRIQQQRKIGLLIGIKETIPTFRSLAIIYDPLQVHPDRLIEQIRNLSSAEIKPGTETHNHWLIPVCYGNAKGPDLDEVAELTKLPAEKVISLHQQCEFNVYMLGFLPGFAFLGDTPAALHLPRKSEPRLRVPAGSVAIAMQLTGIYPWDSPGGWHILGNCPVPLFQSRLEPPALFQTGDRVSFRAIDDAEFDHISGAVNANSFDRQSLLLGEANSGKQQ